MVVSSPGHGAELCTGPQPAIMPPECDGPRIARWDWSSVSDATTWHGVTWGTYHLVGAFDGTTFTLTQPPSSPRPPPPPPKLDFSPPCPTPPGGWPQIATSLTTYQTTYQAFMAAAQSPPDFAGMWIDQLNPLLGDPGRDIVTVAYTGDVERHRAELNAIWKGPLCVIQRPRSLAELLQVQQQLRGFGQQLGLHVLSTNVDELTGKVEMTVIAADPAARAALDRRFGPGIVVLTGELAPLSGTPAQPPRQK
jgi:hypothetical protein